MPRFSDPNSTAQDPAEAKAMAEAERRVQQAARTKKPQLSLDGLRLTSLPESLRQLTWLKLLSIQSNKLIELPEWLSELTELRSIVATSNAVATLPSSFGRLVHLTALHLAANHLKELPESICQLTSLQTLDVEYNDLKALPDNIGQLTSLRILDLGHNRLTSLPSTLREHRGLVRLHLHGNKSLGLPSELVLGGVASNILEYYFRSSKANRPLNEVKLILVGRGGVGKTSLIKRLVDNSFDAQEPETPGIEIRPWSVKVSDGDSVRLHVWDFGGQEILHATHQFFLTERSLYLLVLSGREGNPTQDAEYWLQLIKSFGGRSPTLIALNKASQFPFDVNRGLLLEKYPFIKSFIRTDCYDGSGIDDLKHWIGDQTDKIEHRKVKMPAEWFAIKERLASMDQSFVTWRKYQQICSQLGETEEQAQETLAQVLHILGIALNFRDDPRLRDTHVLNPRWVTEGIYSLLRGGQKRRTNKGVLAKADLKNILDPSRYPEEVHEFLLQLMEKFQLCFELPGQSKNYLVPELLGENQPDLHAILDEAGLGFRYQYEVLPEGLLPRFIVQTHTLSEGLPRWRTGVVLQHEGCMAIVRADVRERRVDIHIVGDSVKRRDLLSIIRSRFGEQHREFRSLCVVERVPIPGDESITVSYSHMLDLEFEGEHWFRPEDSRRKISIKDLLNSVESEERRSSRGFDDWMSGADWPSPPQPESQEVQPLVCISYNHKDQKLLNELRAHLHPLEQEGRLLCWSDQEIAPGSDWQETANELSRARLLLLLVSPDFLASYTDHGSGFEPLLQQAHRKGVDVRWLQARACTLDKTPLAQFQPVLPSGFAIAGKSKAVRDTAWNKVSEAILKILQSKKSP